MPQEPVKHKWAVTGQEEEDAINDNGTATTLHTVHFKTNTGHQSHVMVTDEHFTPANIAAMIEEKAAKIAAIHGMNSSNAPQAG